jgi:quinohemoprotein ethanol dehydrogenase
MDAGFKVDPAKSARGFGLYSHRCMSCHGAAAVAGGQAPDLRASAIPTDAEMFDQVVRGGALELAGMPKYHELDAADLEALRHYIRTRARAAAK